MHKKNQTYTHDGYTMRNNFEIVGDICFMELTQGKTCRIDVLNIKKVGNYRWSVNKQGRNFIPITNKKIDGKKSCVTMRTLLFGKSIRLEDRSIDGNGLNNTLSNRVLKYEYNGIRMLNKCRIKNEVCYMEISQDKWTKFDVSDMALLGIYRWHALRKKSGSYYAKSSPYKKELKTIWMHRIIMSPTNDLQVDHIHHRTLDNRRSQLRIVTSAQNALNYKPKKGYSSKYSGVSLRYPTLWRASIHSKGKTLYDEHFRNEDQAGRERAKAFVRIFGPDANPKQTILSKEKYNEGNKNNKESLS